VRTLDASPFAHGFVKVLLADLGISVESVEVDPEYLTITFPGWKLDNPTTWDLLSHPLARALRALAQSPDQPAVSWRNYHCFTATLTRSGSGDLVVLIGGNNSPFSGSQRRCAERMTAMRIPYLGLDQPFGAVTGNEPQPDDTTGIHSLSGARVTCDDCRHELPNDFGWRRDMMMMFFVLSQPQLHEVTTFGDLLDAHATLDALCGRKARMRTAGAVR
jgi:hypothetical protein